MLLVTTGCASWTKTELTPLNWRERLTMVGLAIDSGDESDGDSAAGREVPSNRQTAFRMWVSREKCGD